MPKVKGRIGKIGEAFKQKRVIRNWYNLQGSWVSYPSTRECGFLVPFSIFFSFLFRIKQTLAAERLVLNPSFHQELESAIVKV